MRAVLGQNIVTRWVGNMHIAESLIHAVWKKWRQGEKCKTVAALFLIEIWNILESVPESGQQRQT